MGLRASRSDFHQPAWFNLGMISRLCFSRVAPKCGENSWSHRPFAFAGLFLWEGEWEGEPSWSLFSVHSRAPLQQREFCHILFTWACTHVKCKGCTGHWRSWHTVHTWHCCWHVSAQSPPLSRTAQPHSEIITWRLNTTCFYPCVPLQHKSTWTWRETDNAIKICEQTEDQTLPAVWLSNMPKMCKGTNKTMWWNMLTQEFACHWVGIYCTVWGKSALHDLVWARSGFL